MPAFIFYLRLLALLLIAAAGLMTLFSPDERFPLEPDMVFLVVMQSVVFGVLLLVFAAIAASSYRVKRPGVHAGRILAPEVRAQEVPAIPSKA